MARAVLDSAIDMGTDIHLFLEWDERETGTPFEEGHWTDSLSQAEIFLGRDYAVFLALAGVPNFEDPTIPAPLFAPRGLPDNLSLAVLNRYYRLVEDNLGWTEITCPMLPPISRETAKTWVKRGLAHYGPSITYWDRGNGRTPKEVERSRVSDTGWHTLSWLTPPEFRQALAHFMAECEKSGEQWGIDLGFEWQIMIHTMNELERRLGSERVRLVFWFDS